MFLVGVDRDGTIIEDADYLGRDDNWKNQIKFLDNAVEGLKKLTSEERFKVIVITNQAGVARGYFDWERIDEINRCLDNKLREEDIILDGWYSCPFVSVDYAKQKGIPLDSKWINDTDLRKPGTGMLAYAVLELSLRDDRIRKLEDFKEIYVVGDKTSDVLTGLNANGKGIWITRDLELYQKWTSKYTQEKIFSARDLLEAADIILEDIKTCC